MKNWRKLGLIYEPEFIDEALSTHSSNPLPISLKKNVFRIFFSGRSEENKSSVGWFDFNIKENKILDVCDKALISCEDGSDKYYSHGISLGCFLDKGYETDIYFMAWQIHGDCHWRGDIGRFSIGHNKKFKSIDLKPFMGSDDFDPVSLSYPFILKENGLYKMWYGSTITWKSSNGEMIHVIKYATSNDGVNWDKHGIAIPYEEGVAQAFSRPCVVKHLGTYHMWFSFRSGDGSTYRIGYAKSDDGVNWVRDLESGIYPSKQGWDSEMVCYPYVFSYNDNLYMLYNGNGYGKTGIGIAVLDVEA